MEESLVKIGVYCVMGEINDKQLLRLNDTQSWWIISGQMSDATRWIVNAITLYKISKSTLCRQYSDVLEPFSTYFFVINWTSTLDCPSETKAEIFLCYHPWSEFSAARLSSYNRMTAICSYPASGYAIGSHMVQKWFTKICQHDSRKKQPSSFHSIHFTIENCTIRNSYVYLDDFIQMRGRRKKVFLEICHRMT